MRAVAVAAGFLIGGCEWVFPLAPSTDAGGIGGDARVADAADAASDAMLGPFSPGVKVGITPGPAAGAYDTDLSLTLDESQLAFARYVLATGDSGDVYLAQSGGDPRDWIGVLPASFSAPMRTDGTPKLGPDGRVIWISATVGGAPAEIEAYRRSEPASQLWQNASMTDASGLNTALDDRPSTPTAALDRMIVDRSGQLFEVARPGAGQWLPARDTLDAVNALGIVHNPQLSADGTVLVFAFAVGGAQNDVYIAERPMLGAAFGTPVPIAEINTPDNEGDPWLSADGRRLWFSRNGGTLPLSEWGIYYAER